MTTAAEFRLIRIADSVLESLQVMGLAATDGWAVLMVAQKILETQATPEHLETARRIAKPMLETVEEAAKGG